MADRIGARAWAAAQRFIGVRFRLHGRDPASGLDCVGLVAAAYAAAGVELGAVPDRYRLSGPDADQAATWLRRCGASAWSGPPAPGDIALIDFGAAARRQLHLALLGPTGAIHAHAGLGRVVWSPVVPATTLSLWRITDNAARF